ncbi:MAG: hypothetical protein LVQ97_03110 [Candidatus Micrarchaeales archaeon]|uniref:Transcriptional regulator, TrmB n=1 Tax=Candidatus Micrarchaeum acidiphilum ARMAN-2 TaxID=425595 RepID=C7DGB2_MICA2|nr:MAG: transcriptional regulator, TrmB [Candidatus Micrarchaeum acidiphilum ARMAN-2]MCW6161148.1 hypothetical protein [Candidatus Micrarchaeales archaeon]
MDEEQMLAELGFTNAESRVYMDLLKFGDSKTGSIMARSGLYSSVVYNSLKHLMEEGFVAFYTRGRIKYFSAADPSRIVDAEKEKMELAEAMAGKLSLIRTATEGRSRVFIFEGRKAVRTIFNDILSTLGKGDEQLVIGISDTGSGMGEFIRRWEEKRVRSGIRKRVLVSNKSKEWLSYYGMQKLVDIRTISNSLYINMSINIYDSKVVLILWAREPTYILIEGKEISKNFRSYFEMLWQKSKRPRI